ncbi:unnamed protein product [Rotaria sordida]|uniref:Uncharacterized protein n=1 Tax=Rotaria sordida TaxID=392033 RepID=A0A813YPG3_9BILA|nr:unnamed protein product [Rotaria sordida]
MQPYPYAGYPNANGATMPVGYMTPRNYQQNVPPLVNQSSDRHAGQASTLRPTQYASQPIRYPPNAVPPGYRPGYPAPGLPPPPMNTMMPGMPPNQAYYYDPNGLNPSVPPDTKTQTTASKKGATGHTNNPYTMGPDGTQNEAIKSLVSNGNINDLLNHQGTKVKVSKIYRITKTKPDIRKDDSSDDDLKKVSLESARSVTNKPRPPVPAQRAPSAASSCSHCSTCSNCSCSECRNQGQGNFYDDCPECRMERAREQAQRQNRK